MKRHLAVLLILSAIIVILTSCSTLSSSSKTEPTVISVSGNGIVYLEADMVKFSINVSETAYTTGEAQQRTNKKMAQILDLLKKHSRKSQNYLLSLKINQSILPSMLNQHLRSL